MTARRKGLIALGLYLALAAAAAWRLPGRERPAETPRRGPMIGANETIAVLEIDGPISFSAGGLGGPGVDGLLRKLKKLRRRGDVRAVILRINSPGGSVAAVQEIHQEVLALRKAGKAVVASFGDVAASGGYYVAAACDRIVANPGTLTGSIGVLLQVGNVEELFRKFGVSVETIKSGGMKDAGSPFRKLTAEERRVYQDLVSDAYDQFFRAVQEGRNMPPARLRALADGRVFTGRQALSAGLVDALGGFDAAVDAARQLAGIRNPDPPLLYTASQWDRVISFIGRGAENRLPLPLPSKRMRFEYVWE